ncbi:LPS-assembly protein LptD [Ruegeria arenilitoris]|uniref:LPS-assembly protein LptD n=1 Tax=Ruegeria arenilitoris TaxID=1173585 RepID=UPI00147ACE92|nr:LPS assembly protein LptD [Ruegeria arenilitoris]
MRSLLSLLLSGVLILSQPTEGSAQSDSGNPETSDTAAGTPALLVADKIFITPDNKLVAEGNVEAYQGDIKLTAESVVYDREAGSLSLTGPIRLDEAGETTLLADSAELDSEIQNGLLTGARMVFDQQIQIASVQAVRAAGRYTQFSKVAATSCHVCADGRSPLWQIRARKVTHDQVERQLYFEGAQLRIMDLPVFYFPVLRLPDPTLERATGFLTPSIRTTSQLGTGIRVPYFIRLGDHKDLTLTPYISSNTRTVYFRYRQAFKRGRIRLRGAFTRDDLRPDENRGYFFADGQFSLGKGYRLKFDIRTTSDDAYLADYTPFNPDRLRSEIAVERIRRDTAFRTGFIHYESLRDREPQDEIPSRVFDLNYRKRYFPKSVGGEVQLAFIGHAHQRTSTEDVIGRDIARATFDAEWVRSWTFVTGLRTDVRLGAAIDTFDIRNDSAFPSNVTRTAPRAALTLRYPMVRREQNGARQFLEPIVQLGWANVSDSDVPNDESTFQEFDQGNLLSLSRFPAVDRREDSATAVVGLNWARYRSNGWEALATVGQVFRSEADPDFTLSSGLQGTTSDLLLAGQLRNGKGLTVAARGLLNSDLSFSKAELRTAWSKGGTSLSGSYVWLEPDPVETGGDEISELWLNGGYRIDQNWRTTAYARYDFSESEPIRAGLGVTYRNECVQFGVTLTRRFTSTSSIEPTTEFGFTLAMTGYSVESGGKKYKKTCS